MSIVHNIIYKRPLNFSRLNSFVSTIDGAMIEQREEKNFYYWIDGKSTRGFDITIEQNFIEVRNTVLSNKTDYELTNKIVNEILIETEGLVIREDNEQVTSFPIFDEHKIYKTEIRDCETIQLLSGKDYVTIYGPIRKVYFGKCTYKKFKLLKDEQLKDSMFNLILKVNYQITNFETGNIMQVTSPDDDKEKIMKLLTNTVNCIIGKYDNILLYRLDAPIMITNDILNEFLPSGWTLVDEYTIVAPIIEQTEWKKLLAKTEKYNMLK